MSAPGEMNELADRKRLLIAQADLHRTILQAEMARCQARVDAARQGIRAGGPWLAAGSALAGLLLARKWRTVAGWVPTALAAWRWYRKFKGQ